MHGLADDHADRVILGVRHPLRRAGHGDHRHGARTHRDRHGHRYRDCHGYSDGHRDGHRQPRAGRDDPVRCLPDQPRRRVRGGRIQFDWSAWLAASETVTTKTITPSAGITVNSSTEAAGVVTVWVSGGVVGAQTVACKITTNAGRTDERTITLVVTDR